MKTRQLFSALLLCAFTSGTALAQQDPVTKANPPGAGQKWAATWATGMSGSYGDANLLNGQSPALNPAIPNPKTDGANDQTFRMVVKPDLWGNTMRFKFSNVFGIQPVTFSRAAVGLRTYGANVRKGTTTLLSFNGGAAATTIPAGQEAWSDPVTLTFVSGPDDLSVRGRSLAVSFHVSGKSGPVTLHPNTWATSYLAGPGTGDRTQEENDASYPYSTFGMFFLEEVDVVAPSDTRVLVGFGSSSADGYYSTLNGYDKFLDQMSRRLHAVYGNHVSVVNTGIGGDTAVNIPASGFHILAQTSQQRLDRDVIGISGVTDTVFYLGVNDYTIAGATSDATIQAYKNISQRLHAANINFIMATITSTVGQTGAGGSAAGLANYAAVNGFIRNSGGVFDSVADFQAATADASKGSIEQDTAPLFPQFAAHSSFNPAPDFLHQGRAGMQAEGFTLDITLFAGPGR